MPQDSTRSQKEGRGYLNAMYAQSLSEFGKPVELPACGGWVLGRSIPGTGYQDAMGCYPLFVCRDWHRIHLDMAVLAERFVCVSLVADTFAAVDLAYLKDVFDFARPFKRHLILDLAEPPERSIHKGHRRYARRSLEKMYVEIVETPLCYVREWSDLYDCLIARHEITGIRAFSRASFQQQLQIPGLLMFLGRLGTTGQPVGALLVMVQGEHAYAHLSAFSPIGYEIRASYGIHLEAAKCLQALGVRRLDLGAGAGLADSSTDGLRQFKEGWANGEAQNYFCGRVFDKGKYEELCRSRGESRTDYFPAYRAGEFG